MQMLVPQQQVTVVQQQPAAVGSPTAASAAAAAAAAAADQQRKRKLNTNNANPPSCVVFVAELPPNTCELEVKRAFQEFGKIEIIFMMPAKRQALVEFLRLTDAERLLTLFQSGGSIIVNGGSVLISFSNRPRIDLSQESYLSAAPQNLLLMTIYNLKMEFDCEAIRQICSPYGLIERCIIVKQQDGLTRVLIEFDKQEDAVLTKPHLNGANMYAGCNCIRCDYARPSAIEHFTSRETIIGEYKYQPDQFDPAVAKRARLQQQQQQQPRSLLGAVLPQVGDEILPGFSLAQAGQCIIVVRGLSPQMNCDRLFNLLSLYGNVARVKFLTTREGFALVEMLDAASAQHAVDYLNGQRAFGSTIKVSYSDQATIKRSGREFTLPDGTPAEKVYGSMKLNRFMTPESAAKNQAALGKTGPILYYWGCPEGVDEEALRGVLAAAGAPDPIEITRHSDKGITGWITFASAADATDAVCLANHTQVNDLGRLKLSYAVNKK